MNRKHFVLKAIMTPLLIAVSLFALAGCAGRNESRKHECNYSITRPDWIREAGFENVPEELADKHVGLVEVVGDEVWFGLHDFGAATLSLSSNK